MILQAECALNGAGADSRENQVAVGSERRTGEQGPLLSIVLPAFNEAGNVGPMAARLGEVAGALGRIEIIFVDDCSRDGTLAALRRLAAADPRIRYVSFTRNFGHQSALRAGLRHATGDAVVLMDCDFEHPPELIPEMVARWREGARIVAAQRESAPGDVSLFKRLTSRLYYRVLDAIGDVRIEPGSADFLLLDRAVVDTINGFEHHDLFLRGLVRWLGYPLVTVPYRQGVRSEGESSYTLRRMVDLAVTGIIAHSVRPLRIAIHLALAFALIGVLLLVYSVVSFLAIGHTVAGWTSIMSAIAILGAGQFLVLGIIGEYVGRVLRETRRWPAFLIAETEASPPGAAGNAPREEVPRQEGPHQEAPHQETPRRASAGS
ncbi:putative glycosyltransferase [Rhodoplanes serenus]|uniref:Glycosyltransferase n=1 Tax=Rhodoplanes serenus TaxID=200615 RepID=A0A3S4B6I3_9BRAD|nr:putative glycosyltransferase [Rhodoplanes serenus]